MNKLVVKLEQHTPLIHFQHSQEDATLRASEVKPKLDKFILRKLGDGDYNEGIKKAKENKWLVGKGEHPALNYKMRIEVDGKFDISMPKNVVMDRRRNMPKCNEYGKQLYTTPNYPDNNNSLIMGNMGGRVEEELLNFTMYKDVTIFFTFIDKTSDKDKVSKLKEQIESDCVQFFGENNFGNRTSKGFGSFTVNKIDDKTIKTDKIKIDWQLEYVLFPKGNDRIRYKSVYKDIFTIVNQIWRYFKRNSRERMVEKRVFLGVQNSLTGNEERIPSPLMFKPIIKSMNRGEVTVEMLMFLQSDVIESANADIDDFYELIDKLLEEFTIEGYNLIHDIEVI